MHIKIQGGGEGKYSNAGSCSSLISYLEPRRMEHDGWNIFKQGFKYYAIWSNKIS